MHPQGLTVKNPTQLADMLVPFMGNTAKYMMGIALLGAGFSSLLGNTQRGMVLLNAGFDWPVALNSKPVKWGCFACIVIATVLCFMFNGSPTELIFLANVATAVSTPVAGFFMTLMIFRKDVNKGYGYPWGLQIAMTLSYIFVLVITVYAMAKYF